MKTNPVIRLALLEGSRLRRTVVGACAILALLLAAYYALLFGRVWSLRHHNPRTTAFMASALEHLQSSNPKARLRYHWVPYDRISVELKRAVIAAEDQRFLTHDGFDVEAMEKAFEKNARRGRIRRGGSTISQQLAKNLFLSPQRTYFRKAQEAVITMMIEHLLSKRRILEIYLNVIEWGDGIYGAEAAAQYYYEEPAAHLDREEAARLAAIIPKPRYYSRNPETPYIEQRMEALLDQMEDVRVP
jgi:monofunctional biosynthetic peptidoglycan transglycosylase